MKQLREFAQHNEEFTAQKVKIVAISVDDIEHNKLVWEKSADRKFPVLSDPGAKVIRQYGLLHAGGHDNEDIALRTTLLIDENGVELWRRVSSSAIDIPKVADILPRIPPLATK